MGLLDRPWPARLASRYSGRRRSFSRSTEPRKSQWLSWETTELALTETYSTFGFRIRSIVCCRRRLASASPRTASPSRLRLRVNPFSRASSSIASSVSEPASNTRWPTVERRYFRAMGITTFGRIGAAMEPAVTRIVSIRPRNSGAGSVRLRGEAIFANSSAATLLSSGRATRSTKLKVNSTPCGSWTMSASCFVAGAVSLTSSHLSACSMATSTRPSMSWFGARSWCAVFLLFSVWEVMVAVSLCV